MNPVPGLYPSFETVSKSLFKIQKDLGHSVAVDLLVHFGGTMIYIPKQIKLMRPTGLHSKLLERLGAEVTRLLIDKYPGKLLDVPKAAVVLREARNREIIRRYGTGICVADLAQNFELTERHIYTILTLPI